MTKWIIESLGAIAQQGGAGRWRRCLSSRPMTIRKYRLKRSRASVAFWHRPNEIEYSTLEKIYSLTSHREPIVAESALAALQNLADVGCQAAEAFFSPEEDEV
jgi:hypothetical protein